jgi:predicted TIM-barrel fold metal-dependent hydrolase
MTTDQPLVDAHFHVYTTDMPLVPTAWHRPPEDATIERALATLDAHGVTFGVIAAASLYGDYNDYMLEAVRRHKHRLRATAIVKPTVERHTLEALDQAGFVGIRFMFRRVPEPPDLAAPEYRMLLRRIADLGWHVHINDDGARLPRPIAALEAAGVKLVIDHFGHPDTRAGLDAPGFRATLAAVERGRTWVKLSGGYRMTPPDTLKAYAAELLKVAGAERLLWGSDWPFAGFEHTVRYADTVAALADWVPDAAARRQITGETPLRLYFARC